MVQISNSNPEYRISNSGIKQENVQNTIAKSKQVVTDNFESNSVGKSVTGSMSDPKNIRQTMLLIPPMYLADKLVDRSIGNSNGGVFSKIASLGDKISHALKLDKVVSKETGSKITNFIKNNRFTKYFTKDYKAIPKSSFAKGMTLSDKYLQELTSAIGEYAKSGSVSSSLNPETLATLSQVVGGADAAGVSSASLLSAADDLIANGVREVETKGLLAKKVDISAVANKYKAANMQFGETSMGGLFAKGALKTKDLLTFGGGLLGLFFAANGLIQAVRAAKEAPKGEKKATFMHVISEQYLGILLFQPSINLLYKAGGNKYRGMSVEARNALKELIQKANSNPELTKDAYKIAKMQKDLLLRGVDKDKVAQMAEKGLGEAKTLFKSLKNTGAKVKWWEKPLKFAGRILDTGLDKIKNPSKLGKAASKVKGFLGGFGRFAIIMFVLQPILQKPITKLFHKIFGEPKTYLAKQSDKKGDTRASGINQRKLNTKNGETNFLKIYTDSLSEESNDKVLSEVNAQQGIQSDNTSAPAAESDEIAALNLFKKKKDVGYIPSIEVDNSYVQKREKELEKEVDAFIKQTRKNLQKMQSN